MVQSYGSKLSLIWNNISRVNQVDTELSPWLTSLTPCVHIFIFHIFPESISRENLTKHQSAFPVVIILSILINLSLDGVRMMSRENLVSLGMYQFKVDRLQIILVAEKYISTCRNCSSVGYLKCVQFHNWFRLQ